MSAFMPPWILVEGSPALDEPKSRDSGSIGIEAYHLIHKKGTIPREEKKPLTHSMFSSIKLHQIPFASTCRRSSPEALGDTKTENPHP